MRSEEEITGNCRIGPHRDDVQFLVNDVDARRFASAGQQRTIVLALKLAELELIKTVYGKSPILLLYLLARKSHPIQDLDAIQVKKVPYYPKIISTITDQ